jgi:hypothetical protein
MQLNWGSLNEICLQDSKFSGEKQKAIGRGKLKRDLSASCKISGEGNA